MKHYVLAFVFLLSACGEEASDATRFEADAQLPADSTVLSDMVPSMSVEDAGPDAFSVDASEQLLDAAVVDCGEETQCGNGCVDILEDANHCGGCGRTCVFPNAVAQCEAGQCQMGDCAVGFFDADGDESNGCELADECVAGTSCVTSCDSNGVTACNDGQVQCLPPAESCNALDDSCNGQCDEGAISDCRRSVARSYGGNGHAYHRDVGFLTSRGFNIESRDYFYVYTSPYQGMRPMFLCPKGNGRFFLASGTACEPEMRSPVAELGFWSPVPLCNSIPLYGLYEPSSDNHFYTTSEAERASVLANLGYEDRGVAGYVWREP